MDFLVLALLLTQLGLGLLTLPVSLHHLDGANMLQLMSWARSVVTFDPALAVASLEGISWLFKAHLLLGMTIFMVFPFSRLVHIWSAPLGYLGRPYQIVRQR
jgi:nitrate reductase gamma subunit